MAVKQIKTGRNKGRYIVSWRDENHERHFEMVGYNRKSAEDIWHKRITQRAEKRTLEIRPGERFTFAEVAAAYQAATKGKKASWETDKVRIKRLAAFFGDRKIGFIRKGLINEYSGQRMQEGVQGPTINREIALLKTLFEFAIDNEWADRNPARKWEEYPENPVNNRVVQWGEYRELCAAVDWLLAVRGKAWRRQLHLNHFKYLIPIAFECGGRREEVVTLKWDDIDLHTRQVCFWYRKGRKRELKSRWVPMTDTVYRLLAGLRKRPDTPYLFPDERGHIWKSKISFYRLWALISEEAGLPDIGFHRLRHSYCSHLANNGLDSDTRMELMGHASPITQMRYTHIANERKRLAADILNRLAENSGNSMAIARVLPKRYDSDVV